MSELLPCPFHKEVQPALLFTVHQINDDWWHAQYICDKCGVSQSAYGATKEKALEAATAAWNTRYERTCHIVFDDPKDPNCRCDVCGAEYDAYDCEWWVDGTYTYDGQYCKECGAKVVDE